MADGIVVVGGGGFGLAMAHLLGQAVRPVSLWLRNEDTAERLLRTRQSPRLAGLTLEPDVSVVTDLQTALDAARLVILAVPTQYLRGTIADAAIDPSNPPLVANLAKGIETSTAMRCSDLLFEVWRLPAQSFVAISGPSHAEELAAAMPTAVVAAGVYPPAVTAVQERLSVGSLRVYQSNDLIGVELGGALKNIIAIAAGIVDGLGLGDNTLGALLTRGLAEISRLGQALGARPETFAGLSGIGDLVTTCVSRHSRNREVGRRLAAGQRLDEILGSLDAVAEGVPTCRAAVQLAGEQEIEMPITQMVYAILFEGKRPAEAVAELMSRRLKAEVW